MSNKAIVDCTSPALCTPVSPFPTIGDAVYRQHAGGGPSDGQRPQKVKKKLKLETVSIAEPLQNRQHARLMLSTLERKGKTEG